MLFALLLLVFSIYIMYYKLMLPFLYWKRRNIFYVTPWSRLFKVFLSKKSFAEAIADAYLNYPQLRYYGSYQFLSPSLFVRDVDLIKQITIKDFDHFTDHISLANEKTDPILGKNLFSLTGQRWREMRNTMSPTFTSSKMKAMFVLMVETAEEFTNYLMEQDDEMLVLEMRHTLAKFTNDVIANCAFGIKCDSMHDPNNDFYKMAKDLISPSPVAALRALLYGFFPKFYEFFKIPLLSMKISDFFQCLIKDTLELREQQNISRPDMIHLLMEARKGQLKFDVENMLEESEFAVVEEFSMGKTRSVQITDDIITAQAIVFFIAGFSTTASLMSFMCYELALNLDVQDRLRKEIDSMLTISNCRTIDYEKIVKMKYLDQVVSETLRKWPPAFALNRVCVKDYLIPPTQKDENPILIEKGCLVTIPVIGIHQDPRFYPDPTRFDPDRFNDANKAKLVQGVYIPFGIGPRNCIGSRFSILEIKALMVSLLSKFEITIVDKTEIPLKLRKSFTIETRNGIWLGMRKRISL